ncbi:uncharacterized protein LOC136095674 isoform X2 [Hydra vulgaris]|uniref:uncharacterized protein LOC136095674 isoform X2 n=1 Tax=Hydra vulgaris TaxID=6087 RepID=UPI0032EA261E
MGRNDVTIPYAKEKKVLMVNIDADITCNKKQSKTNSHRKRSFNKISIETLSANINCSNVKELPSSSNTSSVQLNLFQYYCGQLFNHGVLKWRYMDETMHIVLMNDYDSDTGDFLWINLFDDAMGLWKFGISAPSKQQVDRDPFSPGLVRELNKRVQWIYNQSVYPSFDGVCECGAGWTTDAHPEGQLLEHPIYIQTEVLY